MRSEGLVGRFGLPAQRDFAIALFDFKAVKWRQYSSDMAADEIESPNVLVLEPMEHGRKIPTMTAKMVVIVYIPVFL